MNFRVHCAILDKLFNLLNLSFLVCEMGIIISVRINLDDIREEFSIGPSISHVLYDGVGV